MRVRPDADHLGYVSFGDRAGLPADELERQPGDHRLVWGSIAQLAAEYETIAAVAQHDRWVDLISRSGLTIDQVDAVIGSESFGPLTAELRRVEADKFFVEDLIPRLIQQRTLDDAEDIGAVLISRVRHATAQLTRRRGVDPDLIAGLLPAARGPMPAEMTQALAERAELMKSRARELTELAIVRGDVWLRRLGAPPREAARKKQWLDAVETIVAYRDRYGIDGPSILGQARTDRQGRDAARAGQAIRRVRTASNHGQFNSGALGRGGAERDFV